MASVTADPRGDLPARGCWGGVRRTVGSPGRRPRTLGRDARATPGPTERSMWHLPFSRCTIGRTSRSDCEETGPLHVGPRSRTQALGRKGRRAGHRRPRDQALRPPDVHRRCARCPHRSAVRDPARFHRWVPGSLLAATRAVPRSGRPSSQLHVRVAAPALVLFGIERLRSDLQTGKWHETSGELLALEKADFGHRMVFVDQAGEVKTTTSTG